MHNRHVNVLVQPGPELVAVPYRIIRELANTVQLRLATVEANLDTLDFVLSTVVCVAFDAVGLPSPRLCKWDFFAMRWFDDDRV